MTKHPAKFTNSILEELEIRLDPSWLILDPMAGVGKIREIAPRAICNELEIEWAAECGSPTLISDAANLPFRSNTFDAAVTSPTYGNRMADHHNAKDGSLRHTYKHYLGRDLHPANTGQMQWGEGYRKKNRAIYAEVYRVLTPGAPFLVNVADHFRRKTWEAVSEWTLGALCLTGFRVTETLKVITPGLRHGENHQSRIGYEWVFWVEKP